MGQVLAVVIFSLVGAITASTWQAAPYTLVRQTRSPQNTRFFTQRGRNPQTKFFTGNNAIDAGAAGAALGVATQYFSNQIFNPCTRGGNRNTNNRIFGGQTLQNGALGFAAGFAGAALVNSALGNPCGR